MWEPGYLIIDKKSGQGICRIEDPIVSNVNCRGFKMLPGFDLNTYPFIVARNSMSMNLINVKSGTMQMLIRDKCDSNWYQNTVEAQPYYSGAAPFTMFYVASERSKLLETHLVRRMAFDDHFITILKQLEGLPMQNVEEQVVKKKFVEQKVLIDKQMQDESLPSKVDKLTKVIEG